VLFYSLRGTANKCGLGWASLVLLVVERETTKFRLQTDFANFLIAPTTRVLVVGVDECIKECAEVPLNLPEDGRVVEGHSRSVVWVLIEKS
jgi:hypothetical protein